MDDLNNKSIQEQVDSILARAKERGVESNFLFWTTFNRYIEQLKLLEQLHEEIEKGGLMTVRYNSKGQENVAVNPAVRIYNASTTSANQTAKALIDIIKKLGDENENAESKLTEFMDSFRDDD